MANTEVVKWWEINQQKYRDFNEMLEDSHLSENEKSELHESYYQECEQIHTDTLASCDALKKELNYYKEFIKLSGEEILILQTLAWFQGTQRDGLRWPNTFAAYLQLWDSYPLLLELSPKWVTEKYTTYIEDTFNSFSDSEKKEIQRSVWTNDDGIFWPNTLKRIWENFIEVRDIFSFQWEKQIPEVGIEETTILEEGENNWENFTPETEWFDQASETEVLSNEEKNKQFIQEWKWYHRSVIRELQTQLGEIPVDGGFWPMTAKRIVEKHPEISKLSQVFEYYKIQTDIDWVLSHNGSPEVFRKLYGQYIWVLGNNLWLPNGFIEAIVKKETTYGTNLNSSTGSKWLMQLTKWPFKDMRGDIWNKIWVDSQKVKRYQNIFKKINLDALFSTPIWDKWTAWERIPSDIRESLKNIQDESDTLKVQKEITKLYNHIKWNSREYDHETNMIIWSVYLAYQYANHNGNIWKTARAYNGDKKVAKNWKQTRDNYANTVKNYYNNLS